MADTKAKNVNYTPEMTAELVEAYKAETTDEGRKATVEAFAAKFAKNTKSVVAKLSREGVYVKPTVAGKKGGVKKETVVDALVKRVPMPENDASSLAKANLTALKRLVEAFDSMTDEADEG